MLPTMFQVNWPFGSGEEAIIKIVFQDSSHGGHLEFPILAVFDVQVTPMLPIKFQVKLTFQFRSIR